MVQQGSDNESSLLLELRESVSHLGRSHIERRGLRREKERSTVSLGVDEGKVR